MTPARFIGLRRPGLSAAIDHALDGRVETIFGGSVARIDEKESGVRVDFEHAATREFDLVIGADG